MDLKTLRVLKKLRQEDIAHEIGIAKNTYSYWENNFMKLPISKALKITKILGVKLEELDEFREIDQ